MTKIVSAVKRFFGIIETDVEKIIAPLTNMVGQLREYAENKSAEGQKHLNDAAVSQAKGVSAGAEAVKANVAADKIESLVA